ncbi:MAG TPA: Na+/H+ antiporter NhaA [Acidimicrobiia bacterium]|nr:Na+/H+ antiporter NhaA [Acidimicrobiia bacterium]
MPNRPALLEFLRTEGGSGVVLLAASALALVWANSPWQDAYHDLWHHEIAVGPAGWALKESLQHWINDALMALFFFVVGLEIKRELVRGELQEPRTAALPVIAAIGGMALPALLFSALAGSGEAARGWGIPMATDIAFAVGVLALLGRHAPRGLKVFLLTLAIVDDIGAILVIAVFYTDDFGAGWLLGALATLAVVVAVRRLGVNHPVAYLPLAVVAWYCTYRSGIHPTIAAVALGLLTPAGSVGGRPVLEELEHRLHPWSSYLVIPVFALANAGVTLGGDAIGEAAGSRLTWAVVVGLVVGKVIGIAGATFMAARTGLGQLPAEVGNVHIIGAGAVGGIGFTVSLFITGLAFSTEALQAQAKIGILFGSLLAALVGAAILSRATLRP